jgi:TonB-linked SusC/RagA family outer membrane protein
MRKFASLFSVLMLLCALAFGQTRKISGVVRDEKGDPIPFATITEAGTKNATQADAIGAFMITVGQNSKLVITSTGYSEQTITPTGNTVTAVLTGAQKQMTEVVVTALGIRRQAREVGYSTATISAAELNQTRPVNPVTGLTGKVSGLQIQLTDNSVNPQVRVTLRGNRSILGNNQALVVVDGIQVDNSYLARLNANDIESFNVLKGASASALYGSEASNGVLVVTTKKGTRGAPRVSYTVTAQTESISYMPNLQTRFGSYGGEDAGSLLGVQINGDPIKVYFPYENQSYGPEYNGQMVPLGGPARFYRADGTFFDSTRMVPYSAVPNGKRKFFDHGVTVQNNVSLSTGDANSLLYLSIQNVSVKGVVPKDKSQRNTFRLNGMRQYGRFRAEYNLTYALEKIDQVGNSTNYDKGGYPLYWEVINQPQHADLTYYKDWQHNPFASPSYYYNAYYGNPYWYIDNNRSVTNNNTFIGNVRLSYKIASFLDVSYNLGYSRNDQSFKNTIAGVTFDPYAVTDPWQAGMIASSVKLLQPQLTDQLYWTSRLNGDALLTFDKTFGDISTKLIVGQTFYKKQLRYIYDNSASLIVPGLYNINYRQGEANINEQFQSEGLIGTFADLTLGYKNWLFLHGTGRNDWVSRLSPQNRSVFYPGADVSVVFSDAIPSLKNSRLLNYGKVRASYTKVGQVSVGPYALDNLALVGAGFPFGAQAGFTIANQFGNPNLKPEFTAEKEVGLELGFLNGRLNFTAAYYDALTTNQTLPSQISSATGFTSALVNLGSMSNKGIELDLRLTPLLNLGPVKWNFGANFSYNKNRVGKDIGGEISLGNNVYATPGFAYPNLKVSDFVRDSATGKIVVDANTGFPTKAGPLSRVGTTVAPYRVGLNTSFQWKSLTLSVVADGQFGGVIFNAIGSSLMFTGIDAYSAQTGRQPFVIPNTVVLQNGKYVDNTTVITNTAYTSGEWRFWANTWNRANSPFVSSSDYWKIREIAITWDIPRSVTQRLRFIQNASLNVSGRNLLMFRPKDNVWTDPEFSTGGISNAVGTTDYYQTPPTRVFGATLNVNF